MYGYVILSLEKIIDKSNLFWIYDHKDYLPISPSIDYDSLEIYLIENLYQYKKIIIIDIDINIIYNLIIKYDNINFLYLENIEKLREF